MSLEDYLIEDAETHYELIATDSDGDMIARVEAESLDSVLEQSHKIEHAVTDYHTAEFYDHSEPDYDEMAKEDRMAEAGEL